MLCLGFKKNDWVMVGDMKVIVSEAHDGKCRLVFDGPDEVPVLRGNAKAREPRRESTRTVFARDPIPAGE